MNQRRKLSDILPTATSGGNLADAWNRTEAAGDLVPLPAGTYVARIESGELETSRTNATPGYKLTFVVVEGEYAGRKAWHDIWLTAAALPMAKRDLGKLGITSLEQLDLPLPQGIIVQAKLALRTDDDGSQFNKMKSFTVLRIETPAPEPFAPPDDTEGDGF